MRGGGQPRDDGFCQPQSACGGQSLGELFLGHFHRRGRIRAAAAAQPAVRFVHAFQHLSQQQGFKLLGRILQFAGGGCLLCTRPAGRERAWTSDWARRHD